MGNCTRKASDDVVNRSANTAAATSAPSARLHSARLRAAAAESPEKAKKKKRRGRTAHNGVVSAAASGVVTAANDVPAPISPEKPDKALKDAQSSNHAPAGAPRTHHGAAPPPRPEEKGASPHKATPHHTSPKKEGPEHSPSIPSSETQGNSHDSIAARMEQGSTYMWLRNTYANPHLRPTPLLTLATLRALRNRSVAFQRLWGVLGQAACVIGPYAATPAPTSPAGGGENDARHGFLAEDDDDEELSKTRNGSVAEPSLVNDEAQLRRARSNGRPAESANTTAPPSHARTPSKPATSGHHADETSEVRVLNQQHISVEGDAGQKRPIVCRGAAYRGKHFWIHKLHSRCCFVLEHLRGVDLNDCTDTLIVLAPTAGAVSISNCRRCLIIAAAAQLRVLSCSSLVLSVNVAGFPVMERSTSIGIAPLLGWYAYSRLPFDFRHAGLSLFTNNYSTIRDVTPPSPSNNAASLSNASVLSATSSSGSPAAVHLKPGGAVVLPATNFVYVDLWELEAAVWRAMAEQRWSQLIAEADIATATASAAGEHVTDGGATSSPAGPPLDSAKSFLTALTPAQSPLIRAGGAAAACHNGGASQEEGFDDDVVAPSDAAFRSMISFGHLSPSTLSKTHAKESSPTTTTNNTASREASRTHHQAAQSPQQPHSSQQNLYSSPTGDSVAPLPRWRQPGFLGNITTIDGPLPIQDGKRRKNGGGGGGGGSPQDVALRQRGVAREAEHLLRVVLRAVPLLPLSALHEATSLLLDVSGSESAAAPGEEERSGNVSQPSLNESATAATPADGAARTAEQRKAARCNPLELALATYTHACAVPATFGAQLIPADFFEQAWKLKLIVLSAKGGGYDLARRIMRDIEFSRRRCFLESVSAMLHAPPPSMRIDAERARDDIGGGLRSSNCSSAGGAVLPTTDEEDAFAEVLWHYLRTTSLTQRCGAVHLLNTAELRCTETTMREFVAPVFYKLCEPVSSKNAAAAAASSSGGNGGRGLHLPWKSGGAHAGSSGNTATVSPKQQEHNVEMRRLFGTAIQRMTGQTCIVLLALMAPKSIPQSFQRPASAGGRSIGGALTPAELDAWAKRAEEARHIFTPQHDASDDQHHGGAAAAAAAAGSSSTTESGDEPTAAEDGRKGGPTFAPPGEGEAQPQTLEERVWPQTVLLNVTVPTRFVSLLQGTLFFKTQMRAAATAGGVEHQQEQQQEPPKKS